MNDDRARAACAWLAWYGHMGVDAAVGEAAIDWLGIGDRAPGAGQLAGLERAPVPAAPPQTLRAALPPASLPVASPARTADLRPLPNRAPPRVAAVVAPPRSPAAPVTARDAPTLAALADTLSRYEGCALKATATTTCLYRGAEKSDLMLIGEAPGREEDLAGKPFVGRAGQLLDRMLAAIGLTEADVHITNIVYWRPPGNRTPTALEAQACRPFLERQIALVEPRILVLLGGSPAKQILGLTEGIMRIRGRMRTVSIGGRGMVAMATLHPAYLLRTPIAKRLAWRDFVAVRQALDANPG